MRWSDDKIFRHESSLISILGSELSVLWVWRYLSILNILRALKDLWVSVCVWVCYMMSLDNRYKILTCLGIWVAATGYALYNAPPAKADNQKKKKKNGKKEKYKQEKGFKKNKRGTNKYGRKTNHDWEEGKGVIVADNEYEYRRSLSLSLSLSHCIFHYCYSLTSFMYIPTFIFVYVYNNSLVYNLLFFTWYYILTSCEINSVFSLMYG